MSGRTLAQVLLRVWGVMLIVWAVASIGNVLLFMVPKDMLGNAPWRVSGAAAIVHMLVYLIAGVFLVRNGDRVGAWLASDIDEQGPPASASAVELVAFRVIGLYFLIAGVRALVGMIASVAVSPRWDETGHLASVLTAQSGSVAMAVVELAAGAFLIWRVDQIVAWFGRGWRAVRSRDEDTPNDDAV